MNNDYLQYLEFKGFTARIKRLSDFLLYDSRNYYSNSKYELEPNWHLIFLMLNDHEQLTVTEIAHKLKFSHPAVIKIARKMKAKGYLESLPHPTDSRKSFLKLTRNAKKDMPNFEKEWNRQERIIKEVVDVEFLDLLSDIEKSIFSKSISERYQDRFINNSQ